MTTPFPPLMEELNQNPVVLLGVSSLHSDQASISGMSTTTATATATATRLQSIKDYDQQLIHDDLHQAANSKYSPCSTDESNDHQQFLPASSSSDSALLVTDNNNNYGLIMKSSDEDTVQEWRMPLKIRFMRKYSSDQMAAAGTHQESVVLLSSSSTTPDSNQEYHHPAVTATAVFDAKNSNTTTTTAMNNNIRVCSDCSTTKTPLWRGGPRGPKSLCNACGIRQRKARRAMAAAAAAAGFTNIPEMNKSATPRKVKEKKTNKETGSFQDQTTSVANKQEKKQRNKLMNSCSSGSSTASCSSSRKKKQKQDHDQKVCFEDWVISLSENHSDFYSVFPQDEKEAAILLMALSCGLVYG